MKKLYTVFMITLLTISSPDLLHASKNETKTSEKKIEVSTNFTSGSYDPNSKIATMQDTEGNSTSYNVTPIKGMSAYLKNDEIYLGKYKDSNYNPDKIYPGFWNGDVHLYGTPVSNS
jgi:hypothetical protein